MFTFILILCVIFVLLASNKKKYNQSDKYTQARQDFPDFEIHASQMSTFSKIINLAVDKGELLNCVRYNKGLVTIVMENGKSIVGMLQEMHVDFAKNRGLISYNVTMPSGKVNFYHTTNISAKEWDVINSLLCLAGSTRGEEIFGNTYKTMGYVNGALKVLKMFQ